MTIRAVLLDADGVVQTTAPDFETRLRALAGDAEAFFEAAIEAEQSALVGAGDFKADLEAVLARFGIAGSMEDAMEAWKRIEPVPGVLELVADLRARGVPCYIASNQQAYRAEHMSEVLGYGARFDGEFYSFALRARKPDPRFFEGVLARLEIAADALLFVDDVGGNVEAARAAGMRGERFDAREHDQPAEALRALLALQGVTG